MGNQHTVAQVMTREPTTVRPDDPVRVAIERMRERQCRRLPVVEGDRVVGIITDRDLRRATNSPLVLRERWYDEFMLDHISVRACMTPNPITVASSTPMVEAAKLMRDRKFGGLPVVDNGQLVGIVTETDLIDYLIKLLDS